MTSDYKKYSLDKLEEWMHDAMSVSEATPQEIYDVIKGVVEENYYTYKHQTSQAYELLALLNGNGQSYKDLLNGNGQSYKDREYEDVLRKMGSDYYEYTSDELEKQREIDKKLFGCDKSDKNDLSEECKGAWSSFWESEEVKDDCMPPWGHSDLEYLIKNPTDKVVKWQLPVEQDLCSGEYYVNFPDDLLEAANLKEGDQVEWVDNEDGSATLRKIIKSTEMEQSNGTI